MTGTENGPFLVLLRAGLWNVRPGKDQLELLREADWCTVLAQAGAHAVVALVADGMAFLPEDMLPPEELRVRVAEFVAQTERANARVNKVLDVMSAFWKKSGLTALVLKGQGIARMYPAPLHRTPGDIDWYFPGKANFQAANRLVEVKGAGLVIDGDSDYHYTADGVVMEHHSRWCDLSAPLSRKRAAALEESFGYDSSGSFAVLSPVLQLMQQNAHILKHALIMGIGWRQLCDLARTYSELHGLYDGGQFRKAAKELHIYRWSRLLGGVLVRYLGLDPACLPFEAYCGRDVDRLASSVEESGNFGNGNGKGMFLSWLCSAPLVGRYALREHVWRPVMLAYNRTEQRIRNSRQYKD